MDGRLPNSFRFGAPLSCHFKTRINGAENLFISSLSKAKKSTWSLVEKDNYGERKSENNTMHIFFIFSADINSIQKSVKGLERLTKEV